MKLISLIIFALCLVQEAHAVRLKDIANIRGVRENQLIGYGLVVGLKGTGDSELEFTNKSMRRMLEKMGMKVDGEEVVSKNVAAVLVTATLPAFARAGNKLDISVNSIGDASSLKGGTLIQTPLKAADQNVYAVAQGAISMGGEGRNIHSTVGSIPNGAFIEKDIQQKDFTERKMYRLTLHNPDITTSVRVAKTVNMDLGGKYARAIDPGTVDVVVPFSYEGKGIELLALVESLQVEPDNRAKVVVNERTGTVIIGEHVRISTVAISHGDISVKVGKKKPKPQKPAAVRGPASPEPEEEEPKNVNLVEESVSVGDLVKSLNEMGVSPKDLIAILQNIKASGALQGELEIL